MERRKSLDQISKDELQRVFVDRSKRVRAQRMDYFHRTGRITHLLVDSELIPLESPHSQKRIAPESPLQTRTRYKQFFNGFLFFLEVGAVLVLIGILFNGMQLLRELNDEFAASLEQPTMIPTPLVVAVVLPSGHTPPTSPGGARPNDAEIPEHLRPLVQSLANLPIPTPAPEHAQRIQIPAIHIDAPVVQGTGWEQLKKGVGQVIGTANPGQNGNLVLAGHNDVFGELFRDLDQLQPGDEFTVYTNQRAYTYIITGWEIVEPMQVEVMNPTPDATATLISCYPYLVDNKRIVVMARLAER